MTSVADRQSLRLISEGGTTKTGLCASFLFVLLALLLASGCQRGPQAHKFTGYTMGTTYHVTVVAEPAQVPADLGEGIFAAVDAVDRAMTTYSDDSELMTLNRAVVGEPFPLSPELAEVLAISGRLHRESQGAFDPTVGPLVKLWGFGPGESRAEPPTRKEIEALLSGVGFDGLVQDPSAGTATRVRDIQLDLSAVAKGYGADKVADYLRSLGYKDFLVEVGGEMVLSGTKAGGELWRIAIETPDASGRGVQRVIPVTDIAVATSGDYRNYFERDGQRFSHTLDPRTGYPVTHNLASVTVLAATAAEADALATVFMVLGAESSLAFAEQRRIPLFLLVKENSGFREVSSTAFISHLGGSHD